MEKINASAVKSTRSAMQAIYSIKDQIH